MLNESQNIAEEFERAHLPPPTIEENGDSVMAIIQRKPINKVIAERDGDGGNVRNPSANHRTRTFCITKGRYYLSC